MDCTDAYREALTRDLSSTASSAPTSTPAPSQRQAAEGDREDAVGRPLRRRTNPVPDDLERRDAAAAVAVAESGPAGAAVAGSGPAVALAKDATAVNGEVIDQR
jgi:hypothetical protein